MARNAQTHFTTSTARKARDDARLRSTSLTVQCTEALLGLVRLLARQAAREAIEQPAEASSQTQEHSGDDTGS